MKLTGLYKGKTHRQVAFSFLRYHHTKYDKRGAESQHMTHDVKILKIAKVWVTHTNKQNVIEHLKLLF